MFTSEIRLLIFTILSFALSLLYLMVLLFDTCQFSEFNYFIACLSVGFFFLTLRRVKLWKLSPDRYKKPTIKSKIVIRFLLPLIIVLDLGLFYCYFIAEQNFLFNNIVNIKEYYGIYLIIVTSWIGIVFNLKN